MASTTQLTTLAVVPTTAFATSLKARPSCGGAATFFGSVTCTLANTDYPLSVVMPTDFTLFTKGTYKVTFRGTANLTGNCSYLYGFSAVTGPGNSGLPSDTVFLSGGWFLQATSGLAYETHTGAAAPIAGNLVFTNVAINVTEAQEFYMNIVDNTTLVYVTLHAATNLPGTTFTIGGCLTFTLVSGNPSSGIQ
jgi:hypothetical protein